MLWFHKVLMGSTVVPDEVGNTKSTSSRRPSPKKVWIVTVPADGIQWSSILRVLKPIAIEAVGQIERGEEKGYMHWQLTFTLKEKKRMSWLKNHFHDKAHLELAHNPDACYDYCSKSETRVQGPFYWPEPLNKIEDYFTEYHCVMKNWQSKILDIVEGERDLRKIYWFWEPVGGIGKSIFVRHLMLKYDGIFCANGKKDDIYYALGENVKTLIIDLPRSKMGFLGGLYTVLEEVKNGMVFSGKYESRTKIFNVPNVIVLANCLPDMNELSRDRWMIEEITN